MSVFKKAPPVTSSQAFGEFLATRAAFISQKTLYGYVKTRMGMKYPLMFEDQTFIDSLNMAKWNLYAACISDLSIFMAAQVFKQTGDKNLVTQIARHWFVETLNDRFSVEEFKGNKNQLIEAYENRLALTDWNFSIEREGAFKESPSALVRWAPIEDKLKKFDEPLVLNSIRFQWQTIRRDFNKSFDVGAFLADWKNEAA